MKVLFVCNQNKDRSKTAEELFSDKFETKSAGLYNEKPFTAEQIQWADLVLVMEKKQRKEIANRYPKEYLQKRILSLDVPDLFCYNQPELIEILQRKIKINKL